MSGESIGFYHATPVNSGYINAPDSPWALDAAEKYEGRASLRLTRTESRFIPSAWQFGVPLQSNVTYTLSAWMKADRAGLPVRCWYQYNQDAKPLALTTEWQRHTVSFTPPADRSFIAIIPSAPGVVWLDALQLEEGNSATEYVPGAAWQYGERIMGK